MRPGDRPNATIALRPSSIQILSDIKDAADAGQEAPFYADDKKIAETVMDFLFASQDASTASLVWTITLMAEHPEVLARVRAGGGGMPSGGVAAARAKS